MAMVGIITSATAGIMSIDRLRTRRVIGFIGVGIGLLVIALSLPRAIAYSYLAMVPSGVDVALSQGRPIKSDELEEARGLYKEALDALPGDAVIEQDFGRLELRRAARLTNTTEERIEALNSASGHFKASIAAAPARSFAWSLAASAQYQLKADPALLNALLRMSYYTGPHEASSMLLRAQVGCGIWNNLDTDVRDLIGQDLRALWEVGRLRSALVDIYLSSPLEVRSAIREIVLKDPQSQKRFDQILERVLKRATR